MTAFDFDRQAVEIQNVRAIGEIMSSTYQDLQKQIAILQKKAREVREQEILLAREQILSIMRKYGLTLADFSTAAKPLKGSQKQSKKNVEIKYRDVETGKAWTGRGRIPKWLEGKDRKNYQIVSPDDFFISEIRRMEFHLLNHKPGIEEDEKIGITPKHYIEKKLADEWKRKNIKTFHPDADHGEVSNPEAASEKINKIYNRLVGKA